jgi:hypothetical protein
MQAKGYLPERPLPAHGGLSTGPKTAAGKQRSAANLPKPHEKLTKHDILGVNASRR